MTALTTRYDEALLYAAELHRTQVRKGTTIPYLAHLVGVSSLVLEAGGDEDQAIAGLLHDAIEDQGHQTSYDEIARRFGDRVAGIVLACSHSEYGGEEPTDPGERCRWRREQYLAHLETASLDVLMVSRADKLHNARAIVLDLDDHGDAVWSRFRTGAEGQLWYYTGLAKIFTRHIPGPQTRALTSAVDAMRAR